MFSRKNIFKLILIIIVALIVILFVPAVNKSVFHGLVNFVTDENNTPTVRISKVNLDSSLILDCRTKEEFSISHLPNAVWIDEDGSNIKLDTINKENEIILYCSIGVRSEKVTLQFIKDGFINAQNLYGGIIEWHNNKMPMVNLQNDTTTQIHSYSFFWSLWVL